MSVAIGYVPGAFGQGGDDPNFLRTLVELGDRYEYDSIWLSDRICSDRFSLEPMVALSLVAGYSDRLKFGTSVLALPLRNPVVLAKQVATLDWLSQGRFFPAVGLGQEDPDEYEACGVPKADRARRTDEAITLMRRLWGGGRGDPRGRVLHHPQRIRHPPYLPQTLAAGVDRRTQPGGGPTGGPRRRRLAGVQRDARGGTRRPRDRLRDCPAVRAGDRGGPRRRAHWLLHLRRPTRLARPNQSSS